MLRAAGGDFAAIGSERVASVEVRVAGDGGHERSGDVSSGEVFVPGEFGGGGGGGGFHGGKPTPHTKDKYGFQRGVRAAVSAGGAAFLSLPDGGFEVRALVLLRGFLYGGGDGESDPSGFSSAAAGDLRAGDACGAEEEAAAGDRDCAFGGDLLRDCGSVGGDISGCVACDGAGGGTKAGNGGAGEVGGRAGGVETFQGESEDSGAGAGGAWDGGSASGQAEGGRERRGGLFVCEGVSSAALFHICGVRVACEENFRLTVGRGVQAAVVHVEDISLLSAAGMERFYAGGLGGGCRMRRAELAYDAREAERGAIFEGRALRGGNCPGRANIHGAAVGVGALGDELHGGGIRGGGLDIGEHWRRCADNRAVVHGRLHKKPDGEDYCAGGFAPTGAACS